MIAPARPSRSRRSQPAWHEGFLAMLPAIQRQARVAFRYLSPEAKQDAVEEVVCNTVVAYARLAELGKVDLAYPTVLARYGVAQFHAGRRVGNRLNSRDALSDYAQRQRRFMVERLDHYDQDEGVWKEALVQDTRTASVPDIVGFRMDFKDWLDRLARRDRKIAQTLATGETTGATARKYGVSAGRISQLRSKFAADWQRFHGEESTTASTGKSPRPYAAVS